MYFFGSDWAMKAVLIQSPWLSGLSDSRRGDRLVKTIAPAFLRCVQNNTVPSDEPFGISSITIMKPSLVRSSRGLLI
ncbi:MAG: hypothetical protein CMQ45_01285 [Gammaproteobacteria bacterium]|nr:hypothetical protein [Gammaproteobacteria bacterium]